MDKNDEVKTFFTKGLVNWKTQVFQATFSVKTQNGQKL